MPRHDSNQTFLLSKTNPLWAAKQIRFANGPASVTLDFRGYRKPQISKTANIEDSSRKLPSGRFKPDGETDAG